MNPKNVQAVLLFIRSVVMLYIVVAITIYYFKAKDCLKHAKGQEYVDWWQKFLLISGAVAGGVFILTALGDIAVKHYSKVKSTLGGDGDDDFYPS